MELPSGTAKDLLQKAEEGHRPSLYSFAAGGTQIFPDGSMDKFIDASRISESKLDSIDDTMAAFMVTYYYLRGFIRNNDINTENNDSNFKACIWAARTLALHSSERSDLDPAMEYKWEITERMLEEVIHKQNESQRLECQTQASRWNLKN